MGAVDVVIAPIDDEALRSKVALLADLAIKTQELSVRAEQVRRADERAAQHHRALAAQQSVMRALAGGGSDDVMSRVAQSLARALGWQMGAYWVAVDTRVRCAESWLEPGFSAPFLERLYAETTPSSPAGIVRRAAASHVPEWAPLAELDPGDPAVRAALDAGLSDALALPITIGSRLVGVIELLRSSLRPHDPQTVATLDAITVLVAQFAHARQTEDETEALQNEFFALVSHELLTPLTSILGYLEELLAGASGEFNADQEQDLEIIDRNARRLFRLVDDLMFVAQVETGKLSMNFTDVDLAPIAREAIETALPSARARNVRIVDHVEPVGWIRGDFKRLGQVIDHLLSNAVKFSDRGGRVEVALGRHGDDAVIEVTDEGFGVPLDEQAQVFGRFTRSSIASEREIAGIGLGLSITKVIVEAHGGSVVMHSVEGKGSTFTVTLPLVVPALDGTDDRE
jgi:signal transduction histidine kinase